MARHASAQAEPQRTAQEDVLKIKAPHHDEKTFILFIRPRADSFGMGRRRADNGRGHLDRHGQHGNLQLQL